MILKNWIYFNSPTAENPKIKPVLMVPIFAMKAAITCLMAFPRSSFTFWASTFVWFVLKICGDVAVALPIKETRCCFFLFVYTFFRIWNNSQWARKWREWNKRRKSEIYTSDEWVNRVVYWLEITYSFAIIKNFDKTLFYTKHTKQIWQWQKLTASSVFFR